MAKPIKDPRPIHGLTRALGITLSLNAFASLLAALANGLHGVLASRFHPDDYLRTLEPFPGSELADGLLILSGLALLPLGLVAGFLALKWIYRANVNAHVFAWGVETAPKWTIWWWFIPVAALFKPYAAMSEIWRVAADPDRWKGLKDPAILRWWWGVHLLAGFVAVVGSAMDRSASTAGQVAITDFVAAGAMLVQVVSTTLYVIVVSRIARAQTALIEQERRRSRENERPIWSA